VRHTSQSAVTVSPVAEPAHSPEHPGAHTPETEPVPRRADAVVSRQRILQAAATLAGDRRTTMAEIAAAAGVGRSTLYRLESTERLVLVTDGITERRLEGGGRTGAPASHHDRLRVLRNKAWPCAPAALRVRFPSPMQ
jgi:AcrR family transcriptional regulator